MQEDLTRTIVIHMVEDMKPGGLERVVATIVKGLDPSRFAPEVWCLASGGAVADELIKDGLAVRVLGIRNYHNLVVLFRLARELRQRHPSIVHTHGYFAGTIGRLAAVCARVPVIIHHVHSTYWRYTLRHHAMEHFLGYFTDKIVCCSNAVADFVEKKEHINRKRIQVIYNGIPQPIPNDPSGAVLRKEFGIQPDERVVGCVASLVANKGHRYLLEAFAQVFRNIPKVRLLIVGDGPERPHLEQQAITRGIGSRVIFTGIRQDIADMLVLMNVAVLPSIEREGLGVAIIEAMAMGIPVVATNIGGIPEVVVNEQTGCLVPPADVDSLAKAVLAFLGSEERTMTMGKMARHIYEESFAEKIMIRRIDQLYNLTRTR